MQVAAHARGSLYMDTLHSTLARKALEQAGALCRAERLARLVTQVPATEAEPAAPARTMLLR